MRVLRATVAETEGFCVHLVESEWDALVEDYERTARERDEARAEVERFRDGCERASLSGIAMRGEIDDLREQVERLRAALNHIAMQYHWTDSPAGAKARAALEAISPMKEEDFGR